MQNACMQPSFFLKKNGNFRHLAYMYVECLAAAAKICSRCQGNKENLKIRAPLLTQSLLLQRCSYLLFP